MAGVERLRYRMAGGEGREGMGRVDRALCTPGGLGFLFRER